MSRAGQVEENELAVKPPQPEGDAGRPVTCGRLRAADAKINAARGSPRSTLFCCLAFFFSFVCVCVYLRKADHSVEECQCDDL